LPVLVRPTARCHPGANHARQSGRQDGGVPSPKRARSDLVSRLDYSLFRRNDERAGVACPQFSAHFRSASKGGKSCIPGPIREARWCRYRLILDRDVAESADDKERQRRGRAPLRLAADPRRSRWTADAVAAPGQPAMKRSEKRRRFNGKIVIPGRPTRAGPGSHEHRLMNPSSEASVPGFRARGQSPRPGMTG
jgi:hypothetical protein